MKSQDMAGAASQPTSHTITVQFEIPAAYIKVLDGIAQYEGWGSRQGLIQKMFAYDPQEIIDVYLEGCQGEIRHRDDEPENQCILLGELPAWARSASIKDQLPPTSADICFQLLENTISRFLHHGELGEWLKTFYLMGRIGEYSGKSILEACRDYGITWIEGLTEEFLQGCMDTMEECGWPGSSHKTCFESIVTKHHGLLVKLMESSELDDILASYVLFWAYVQLIPLKVENAATHMLFLENQCSSFQANWWNFKDLSSIISKVSAPETGKTIFQPLEDLLASDTSPITPSRRGQLPKQPEKRFQ